MDELELRRRLRGLATDQPPERDLWPGIERRLPARASTTLRSRSFRRVPSWALAAAVLLAVVMLWAGLTLQDRAPPQLAWQPANEVSLEQSSEDVVDTLLVAWSELLAIEGGYPAVQRRAWDIAAAERSAALRELDASLVQLASALLLDPESQLLRRLLHQTLQQRIALGRDALVA